MMRRIAIVTLAGIIACGGGEPRDTDAGAADAVAEAVAASGATERDVVYVDVRTPAEFAAGHVRGAINIPHTDMTERWGELEVHRDDSLVVYCRTGRRSGLALQVLHQQGFEHTRNARSLDVLVREGVPAD